MPSPPRHRRGLSRHLVYSRTASTVSPTQALFVDASPLIRDPIVSTVHHLATVTFARRESKHQDLIRCLRRAAVAFQRCLHRTAGVSLVRLPKVPSSSSTLYSGVVGIPLWEGGLCNRFFQRKGCAPKTLP
ncbi:hypothetical protein E2542_SST04927 [Spatholobus suberectus]|nr:hypothetical protein E2542_SST04927 [Spatholobus suberectus]